MAQISVPKETVNTVVAKITEEGGKILSSKMSSDKKEVVLIYNEGNSTLKEQVKPPEQVMVNGPQGLKPIEGTILTKPTPTIIEKSK